MGRDNIFALANRALKSEERVLVWMAQPSPLLSMQRPVDLLDTQDGRDQVEQLLLRAEASFAV